MQYNGQTFACDIDVTDPFKAPWYFTLRRPGREPYKAECTVVMARRDIHVHWKGKPPPDVCRCLEAAMAARIEDILPVPI